ncbi:MAG: hypothetical protein KC731_01400 [Myxococcales bacterium]|nr:hypothetical protein [Myxococcales bacterium]
MALVVLLAACGGEEETKPEPQPDPVKVTPAPAGEPWEDLDEWGLFEDVLTQEPSSEVQRYDVNAPLFSDYTFKRRFAWIPEGTTIDYADQAVWAMPVGTILVKTFSYLTDYRDPSQGERLLETRLLVHEAEGLWTAHTYVFDEAQSAATRKVAGDIIPSSWLDLAGEPQHNDYIVPNTNECEDCHGKKEDGLLDTLGFRTRQIDRPAPEGGDNQIDRFASLGWLSSAPPPAADRERLVDPFGPAPLHERVRSYLDANCGHCHTTGGSASQSALLLSYDLTSDAADPGNWGQCKVPTSAGGATCGHTFDVVPGDPDSSILLCRLRSTDPEVRMPPLVSRVPHEEGIALIVEWINGLEGSCL